MIEAIIFFALFALVYNNVRTNIYGILFIAALFNVIIFPYTSHTNVLLPSALNFITFLAIINLAKVDNHYWYQGGLMCVLPVLSYLNEIDQRNGSNIILGSYDDVITLITVAQLAGGGYAIIARLMEDGWGIRGASAFSGLRNCTYQSIHRKDKRT